MLRWLRTGFLAGALVGAALAALLIGLDFSRVLPLGLHGPEETLTFQLCPLLILGFSNLVHSMAALVALTILGNALIYGAAGGIAVGVVGLIRRKRTPLPVA